MHDMHIFEIARFFYYLSKKKKREKIKIVDFYFLFNCLRVTVRVRVRLIVGYLSQMWFNIYDMYIFELIRFFAYSLKKKKSRKMKIEKKCLYSDIE